MRFAIRAGVAICVRTTARTSQTASAEQNTDRHDHHDDAHASKRQQKSRHGSFRLRGKGGTIGGDRGLKNTRSNLSSKVLDLDLVF